MNENTDLFVKHLTVFEMKNGKQMKTEIRET